MKATVFRAFGHLILAALFGLSIAPFQSAIAADKGDELMGAAIQGDLETVKTLISSGMDVDYTEPKSKATPLIAACWRGHGDVVRYLVDAGANVNAQNAQGDTPLILAAGSKQFKELVPFLLSRGADASAVRKDNMNAVWNLVVKVERYDEGDLVETAKLLAEQGASVTLPINEDFTPLMFASREGSLEMVRFLVENGADVNARTGKGWTPLRLALKEGHDRVASYLKSEGAGK